MSPSEALALTPGTRIRVRGYGRKPGIVRAVVASAKFGAVVAWTPVNEVVAFIRSKAADVERERQNNSNNLPADGSCEPTAGE